MTCKEKLKTDHPEWDEEKFAAVFISCRCPGDFGYLEGPIPNCTPYNSPIFCSECWNREIPEETPKTIKPSRGESMNEEKPLFTPASFECKFIPDIPKMTDELCKMRSKLIDNGFNKEETFWIIKTILEGVVR